MEKDKQVMIAFITAAMLVGLMSVSTASKADDTSGMEKCYGVVKAGMNDCDNNDISCSMKAVIDSDPNYWVYLPKGTCTKLVGGMTKQSASPSSSMGTTGGMGTASGASMGTGSGMSTGMDSGMSSGSTMSPGTSMGTDPNMGSGSATKPAATTPPTSMRETKTKVR